MKNPGLIIVLLSALLYSSDSLSVSSDLLSVPSGIKGDYVYMKDQMKVGYRYMNKYYSGNNMNSNSVSGQEINDYGYLAYGRTMKHEMHSFDFAYGVTDIITIGANMNFSNKSMASTLFEVAEIPAEPSACESHYLATGDCSGDCQLVADPECDWICIDNNPNQPTPAVPAENWNMSSSGVEDIQVVALIKVFEKENGSIHANVGLTLPTGKFDELDEYYMAKENASEEWVMPSPMQLGSGTVDPVIGFTGKYTSDLFMIGTQLKGVFRVTENKHDYSLGDEMHINIWGVFNLFPWFGITGSLKIQEIGNISANDLNMTADLTPYGGYIENTGSSNQILGIGANFILPSGNISGTNMIAVEYELPIKQEVNGIQMAMENNLMVSWQYVFGN